MLDATSGTRKSPFYGPEHEAFRANVRRFVEREIAAHVDEWDEEGAFPRELYARAAEIGLLGLGFPAEYGGVDADRFLRLVATQEFARCGSGGLAASLFSHTIGAPPIVRRGSAEMKARVLPRILSGEKISALAITEPSGGSDVANLQTRARRDGDVFVVDGAKTFITSGMRADYLTVAVRTGGPGMGGISLLLIEGDAPRDGDAPVHGAAPATRPAVARFTLPVRIATHPLGCICCAPRGPVAEALGRLFLARARGELPWFRSVVAVTHSAAGADAVRAALAGDVVTAARFRRANG